MKINTLFYEKYRSISSIFTKVIGLLLLLMDISFIFGMLTPSKEHFTTSDAIKYYVLFGIIIIILSRICYEIFWPTSYYGIRAINNIMSYKDLKKHLNAQNFNTAGKFDKFEVLESSLWLIIREGSASYFLPKNMIIGSYTRLSKGARSNTYTKIIIPLINGRCINLTIGINNYGSEKQKNIEKFIKSYLPEASDKYLELWWVNRKNSIRLQKKWDDYRKSGGQGLNYIVNHNEFAEYKNVNLPIDDSEEYFREMGMK